MSIEYDAIVTAGGVGSRSGLSFNKVLYRMANGKTVLENACSLFFSDVDCKRVIVVCNERLDFTHPKMLVCSGGDCRSLSVRNGLALVESPFVFVHDGARPFLSLADLEALKGRMESVEGAILAYKEVDTLKYVQDGLIEKTIDRSFIYHAQTPQAFRTSLIRSAYEECSLTFGDEASLLEYLGYPVYVVEGSKSNRKLTVAEDFRNI